MEHEIIKDPMTPEEVEQMKLIFNSARRTINQVVDDLKQIAFTYEQYLISAKYEECEVLMGKLASMSVAMQSWNLVKNRLDEFPDPYAAIATGLIDLEDFHNKKRAEG